jgi:hypothetical protein
MKLGLNILLILVMAAGPWLCCCVAGQVTPKQSSTPAQTHSCCCPQEEQNSTDDSPMTPSRPCSCQDERQPGLRSAPDNLDDLQLSRLTLELPASLFTVTTTEAMASPSTSECIAFPFHDCRDILRILHILRC